MFDSLILVRTKTECKILFTVASLLSCLHQLRAENLRLDEHVNSLLQRRDHLLAVNARLAIPLTTQPSAHPGNLSHFSVFISFFSSSSSSSSSSSQNSIFSNYSEQYTPDSQSITSQCPASRSPTRSRSPCSKSEQGTASKQYIHASLELQ